MNRITKKDLLDLIERLNFATYHNTVPWTLNAKDAKWESSIGTYVLAGAYGGFQLHKIVSTTGSILVVSSGGYVTKRELYNQITTILNFLSTEK